MLSQYPCPTVMPVCYLPPPTWPTMCPPSIGCSPQGGAQAQFPTLSTSCLTMTTTVIPTGPAITVTIPAVTALAHCNGAQAQITGITALPGSCGVLPVSFGCPPQAGAQSPTTTVLPTRIPQMCPVNTLYTIGSAQCPTLPIGCTGYQHCPQPTTTVQGGAQAQFSFPTSHCFDPVVKTVNQTMHHVVNTVANTINTVANATKAATHAITGTIHNTIATTVMPTTTITTAQAQIPTMTTTVQPTHLLGCTGYQGCGQAGAQVAGPVGPVGQTGWLGCNQPTRTLATVCTQIGCLPTRAIGCPNTISCPPNTGAQAQFSFPTSHCFDPIKHTINATVHATQAATNAITGTIHNTIANTITRTAIHETTVATTVIVATTAQAEIPTMTTTVQPTHLIGCTGHLGCNQPTGVGSPATVCTLTPICHTPTKGMGCPNTISCPPVTTAQAQVGVGHTGWLGCNQPNRTLATVCTQIGCLPTRGIGCPNTISCPPATTAQVAGTVGPTGWLGCNQPTHTLATVCTQIGCLPTRGIGCPNTISCPPANTGAQAQFSFPTVHCTIPAVCIVTAIAGC